MLTVTEISACFYKENIIRHFEPRWWQIYCRFSSNKTLIDRLTSLSSSWTRVTFPDLGSTLKYSLELCSKVRPYRTGSPSGSVPLRMYTCVPVGQKICFNTLCFICLLFSASVSFFNYQVRRANTLIVFLRVSLVVRHNPEGITVISWGFNTSVVISL